MSKEFTVTVYFPPNERDLLLARSFADRVSAVEYAEGAACAGRAALILIQNSKGGIEGFIAGSQAAAIPTGKGPSIHLPIMTIPARQDSGAAYVG